VSWTVRLSAGSVAGDWARAAAHAATSRTDRKTRVALDFRQGILDLLLWALKGRYALQMKMATLFDIALTGARPPR